MLQHQSSQGLGQAVYIVRGLDGLHRVHQLFPAHGKSQPQPRHTEGLGAGAQDKQIAVLLELRQQALIGEIHVGLIQHHQGIRQAPDGTAHPLPGADDRGGVARIAENEQLYPLSLAGFHGGIHVDGVVLPLGDGDVAGLLQIAVEGVHGKVRLQGGEGLPPLKKPGEQHGNQLVGAVARGHVLRRDAVIGGKGLAQLLGGGVRVAVEGHLGQGSRQLLQDGNGQGQEGLVGVQVDAGVLRHRVIGL